MSESRYSRWDGTQNPFGPDLPVDDLTEQLAEDVLEGWGVDNALQRVLRNGMEGQFDGLRQLQERIRRLRDQQKSSGRPDPLAEYRERLEEAKATELEELADDPSEDARFAELTLDALPKSAASQVRELREYDWKSPRARQQFEQILEDLSRDMLDASFRQLSDGMQSLTEEDLQAVKDMLADLNTMMDQRAQGLGPSQEQFDDFMAKHGAHFPENPATFDELLEALARRRHGDVALHGLIDTRTACRTPGVVRRVDGRYGSGL